MRILVKYLMLYIWMGIYLGIIGCNSPIEPEVAQVQPQFFATADTALQIYNTTPVPVNIYVNDSTLINRFQVIKGRFVVTRDLPVQDLRNNGFAALLYKRYRGTTIRLRINQYFPPIENPGCRRFCPPIPVKDSIILLKA